MERHGEDTVENFIDSCLSLENLIDIHSPFIKRRDDHSRYDFEPDDDKPATVSKFQSKEYMDSFVNPPEFLKEQAKQKEAERQKSKQFPEQSRARRAAVPARARAARTRGSATC